jgi:hypothetical protein
VVFDGCPADLLQVLFNGRLIEIIGIPLDDGDGVLGTVTEAGTETVAEVIGSKSRLAVDDGDGPFGAGRHAQSAAVAFFFVNLDNFSDHGMLLLGMQERHSGAKFRADPFLRVGCMRLLENSV